MILLLCRRRMTWNGSVFFSKIGIDLWFHWMRSSFRSQNFELLVV
jgi:hypothetical protein